MASAVHDYKYSVQVKGRFDLLGNDDYNTEDPEHLIRKMRTQKHESKASDIDVHVPDVVEKPVEQPVEVNQRDKPRDPRGKGPRGRGGFSRSRGAPTGGQRQFDRHSGSDKTGVKPVMKKGGHGTGNWGTIEDELEAQMAETTLEAPVEKETPAEPVAETAPVEEEEGPKTLTLKEYKEQKAKAKVELSTKGARRPNDGKNVFSNMVEVHKSKPTETKVTDVLEEEKPAVDKPKPVFFEFARDAQGRGRGPRPSGPGEFRGRGGSQRFQPRREEQPEVTEEGSSATAPSSTGRPSSRGSRGGGERGRGFGRGRGGPRSFNQERGGHRSFNQERGAPRGGAAAGGDRPSFRGGRGSRGGPRGGFRGGRDHHEERRPEISQPTAPVMDSEADFPALK